MESTHQSEKAVFDWLRTAGGDWRLTVEEPVAEGDQVVELWTFHGTQQGEFYGLPPSGRPVTYSGARIFRLSAGKIVEIWDVWDRLWLWRRLGVLPEVRDVIEAPTEAVRWTPRLGSWTGGPAKVRRNVQRLSDRVAVLELHQ